MGWFRTSDEFTFHRKVIKAGNEAIGAWVRGGSWSSHPNNLTEGYIPPEVCALIAPETVWTRLKDAKLCDPAADGGVQIHDYLTCNPTAEQERARRLSTRARVAKYRGGNAVTTGVPPAAVAGDVRMLRIPDPDRDPEDPPNSPPVGGQDDFGPGSDSWRPEEHFEPCPPTRPTTPRPAPSQPAAPAPRRAPAAQRADIDHATLAPQELAAYQAIIADPDLFPITARPAQTARDLVSSAPAVDVPLAIVAAGAWLRANPTQRKSNGGRFLLTWVRRSQEAGGNRRHAADAAPASPAVALVAAEDAAFIADRWRKGREKRNMPALINPEPMHVAKFWAKCNEAAARAKVTAKPSAWTPTARQIAAVWMRTYLSEVQTRANGVADNGYPFAWLCTSDRCAAYPLPTQADIPAHGAPSGPAAAPAPPPARGAPTRPTPRTTHASAGAAAVAAAITGGVGMPFRATPTPRQAPPTDPPATAPDTTTTDSTRGTA